MTEPAEDWIALPSGVELHVVRWEADEPTGVPHLLVHGLASNARLWDGVGRRLAEHGHPAVAVDQRGHGRSSKPDGPYDMVTVADDLLALIDALGWERPAVAGQSWGGNVVLELGYRHPEQVQVVSCVDGGFIDLGGRFDTWEEVATALAPPKLAGTPADRIRSWLDSSNADWPVEGRDGTMANFELRDDGTIAPWLTAERHLEVLRGLWEHRPSERYPVMEVPVLLIAADTGDVAWTHSKEDAVDAAVAALPTGRAEWFRPAHHDVHAQRPAEVADLLRRAAAEPDFFPGGPHRG
ncbi:MAG: alpha/beta hydrolase [Actinomycetota bacterium]